MAKSTANPDTKLTKTVDGVKVSVDMRAFTDMRFVRLMTGLFKLDKQHDEAEGERLGELTVQMMDALDDLARLMFGHEFETVQSKVAAKTDGYLSFQDWMTFITDVVEAYSQKNADARPVPEHK